MSALPLGPDTVRLHFRDPVLDVDGFPVIGPDGRPQRTERIVEKVGAKFTIISVLENSGSAPVAAYAAKVVLYSAKAALPVDADTRALKRTDAIEHADAVFELSGGAKVKKTLIDGFDHHVRVFCSRQERAGGVDELVIITPRGKQDDRGRRALDGEPIPVIAIAVDAGNTAVQYGIEGTVDQADFTIVLPMGTPIADDDWITVRGRRGAARLETTFSEHADRNQLVATVRSRTGG